MRSTRLQRTVTKPVVKPRQVVVEKKVAPVEKVEVEPEVVAPPPVEKVIVPQRLFMNGTSVEDS